MHKDFNPHTIWHCAITLIAAAFATPSVFAEQPNPSAVDAVPPAVSQEKSSDFANSFKDLLEKSNRDSQIPEQNLSNSSGENPDIAPSRAGVTQAEELHATRNTQGSQSKFQPQYGKPLADSLDQNSGDQRSATSEDGSSTASQPSTVDSTNAGASGGAQPLAPFRTVGGGFAALHGMQLPRPINIPKDASPELREAISAIPNGSVVSPTLLRGSQPTTSDLAMLKKAGVRTIVNLRNEEILVNKEALDCKHLGLNFVNIPMALFDNPTKAQFNKFLSTVDSAAPVYVHCQKGEDRTGTMVAVYRIGRENWDATKAYQEMAAMGFKPMLGSLRGAVFAYSASVGRPCRPPAPDLSGISGMMSIIKH